MGYTYSDYRYRINGVISTDKTVLQNMEILASAAGAWITYDTNEGRWSAIINKSESSISSFDDSNIIGPINVSGTGFTDLYNSVRVEFPHIDLNDQLDYINIEIPSVDRYPNEFDNRLELQYDIINDPVQAEQLGFIELKQSRIDQVVSFVTDFSKIGLKAGDVIDITNSVYNFVNKKFRIITIKEIDGESGSLNLEITALEYNENVYNLGDLYRYSRSNSTGITTIGAIGIPGTPIVTKVETDRKPYVTVSTTAPIGVVEGIEFWYTTDGGLYDENRVYQLLGTKKPETGANVFTFGDTVQQSFDTLNSGNFYIKARAFNSTTTGPYSSPAGFVYTPVQTTDLITQNTQVKDNGNNMLAALALTTLLNNLDKLFRNDGSGLAAGGLFDTFWNLFNTDTGYNFRSDAGNIQYISTNGNDWLKTVGGAPEVIFHTNFYTGVPVNTTSNYTFGVFTPGQTGYYKIEYNVNWGGSTGAGIPGAGEMGLKTTTIDLSVPLVNQGIDLSFTGGYSSKFEDHNVAGIFAATAGVGITLGIEVYHSYSSSYPTGFGLTCEITYYDYGQVYSVTFP